MTTKKGIKMEQIYKIFDAEDFGYEEWYGTDEAIEKYLEEQKEQIPDYDEEDSWTDNLRRYGLAYIEINVKR